MKTKSVLGQLWTAVAVLFFMFVLTGSVAHAATADGALRVEVITAYNLVVDSNAGTPASYAPRSAYIGATFHNDGTVPLTDLIARIGNYSGGAGDTPGVYPTNTHPVLVGPLPGGAFALTHEGGSTGTADATRYISSIPAGGSVTVYWLVGYPQTDMYNVPLWGTSVKPDDDLSLDYDIWATASESGEARAVDVTRSFTFRNEISASANKIFPNGANKVPDYYKEIMNQYVPVWTNANEDGTVGTRIVTEGIWYDLGNVGEGFDNNGDLVPDRNAWMQPVGDPSVFDASAFRLMRTYAVVIVKLIEGGEQVLTGEDQLYFENIPDNNGAVGYVSYEFMPLKPGARSATTPYQEVASGYDNEKFNADYGVALGQDLIAGEAHVSVDKTADKGVVTAGGSIAYKVSYTNAGAVAAGQPDVGLALVIQDKVPAGTVYSAGSATNVNVLPAGVAGYSVLYSADGGATWTSSEPPAASVTDLQWWLNDQLEAGLAGSVGFSVQVPSTNTSSFVKNCAGVSYGDTDPFDSDCATTLIEGSNSVSGTVFKDDGAGTFFANGTLDGTEAGISNVAVRLYADLNGNGVSDSGDMLLMTTNSAAGGTYAFTALPDGRYVVAVEPLDPDVPQYCSLTTPASRAVALDPAHASGTGVSVTGQDFGFAPPLSLDKSGGATVYEGQEVTYRLTVKNHLYSAGASSATNLYWVASNQVCRASLLFTTNLIVSSNTGVANTGWGVSASRSRNRIYWSDAVTGTIWQDDMDPTTTNTAMPLLTGLTSPAYLELDHKAPGGRQYLWWSGAGVLRRVDLAVSPAVIEERFNMGAGINGGLVIDDVRRWIYFVYYSAPKYYIYRQSLDGAAYSRDTTWQIDLGSKEIYDIDIGPDGQKLYFVDRGAGVKFATVDIATQAITYSFNVSNGLNVRGLAVDLINNSVYFSLITGTIERYLIEGGGSSPVQTLADGTNPGDIDIEYGAGAGSFDANTTVTTITLADEYPPEKLSFVTASELPDSTSPLGTLTWNNIGPLNGGDSVSVDVTFRALAQTGNTIVSLLNTGRVSYAEFDNGKEANRPLDTAPTQILPAGSIAGRIWADTDGDGWMPAQTAPGTTFPSTGYEAGESGIGGVPVYLDIDSNADGVVDRTVTNLTSATGFYNFGSLATNVRYRVRVNVAALPGTGITATGDPDDDGVNYLNGALPNDGSLNEWRNGAAAGWFQLGANSWRDASGTAQSWDVTNVNFGYSGTDPVIYGLVWLDLDRDGARDVNEPGLSGATLTLSGAATATFTTGADGTYRFLTTGAGAPLPLGTYTNTLTPPSGPAWIYTFESSSNTFGVANGLTPYDGKLRFAVSGAAETSGSWDIGLIFDGTYTVGDTVYFDLDYDGQQDAGEAGIPGVDMSLYYDTNGNGTLDVTDHLWATQTTSSSGSYAFTNLYNGRYFVVVDENDIPAGFVQTADPDQPGILAVNADGKGVAQVNNANLWTVDFGYAGQGSGVIGDLVYRDLNGNGSYQAGETGISGVSVSLYFDKDGNGSYETRLSTHTTGASGDYIFQGLPDGLYRVEVLTTDSDLDGLLATTVTAYTLTLSNGVTTVFNGTSTPIDRSRDADFGFTPRPSIGDFVYYDANRNGTQDPGENGIPGVEVFLYSDPDGDGNPADGAQLATAVTADGTGDDPVGIYLFENLSPGGYYLVRVNTNSLPTFGGAPLPQTADPDRDGVPCWDDSIPGLPPGDNQDRGIMLSYASYTGADFGYQPPGVIGDLVWVDLNTNGLFDAGERGIPYAGVVLYAGGTPVATNSTDSDGFYSFGNLTDGVYRVSVVTNGLPAGLTASYDADGTPDSDANGIVISNGNVTTIGVYSVSNANMTIDFGYRYVGSNRLSGTVGLDVPTFDGLLNGMNPNGVGAGEYPFAGRTVYLSLWNDAGVSNVVESGETTPIASVTTLANGDYSFENLPDGDGDDRYIVTLAAPAVDLKLTTETGDTTALWVRDTTNAVGVSLTASQAMTIISSRDNIDFAYETTRVLDYGDLPESYSTTVADRPVGPSHRLVAGRELWLGAGVDTEANGQPSADATGDGGDEDGVVAVGRWTDGGNSGHVEVTAGAGSGWLVGWVDFNRDGTFTNANERVVSQAVDSGGTGTVYALSFPIPEGTFRTDGATVLNARFRLYETEPLIALFAGDIEGGEVEDYQFIFGIVGNLVWEDMNGNGVQDAGEPAVSNATVRLYDSGNNLLETQTTAADGSYAFTGLPTNDYSVVFTLPDGTLFTLAGAAGDAELDSDAGAGGAAGVVSLSADADRLDIDAGLYVPALVYGYVFVDKDGDLVRDTGDSSITNRMVWLSVGGAPVAWTNTDEFGYYRFEDVPVGAVTLLVSSASATLIDVPVTNPALSDVRRNRALPATAETNEAYVAHALISGYGVLADRPAEELNFGFASYPLSTALDVCIYASGDAVTIEIWTVNESGQSDIVIYAWIGNEWVEVGRVPGSEVWGEGANRYLVRASGLTPGQSYNFKIVDEAGHVHESAGPLEVRTIRMEAVRLSMETMTVAFNTDPGRPYTVLVSTDLVNWTPEFVSRRTTSGWSAFTDQPFTAGASRTEVLIPVNARAKAFFKVMMLQE